jgi:ketosteroid isomerase-like protein
MATADYSTVEQTLATFLAAFNDLDRPRVEACFTPDATVFVPYGGSRKIGFWNDFFDRWKATRPGPLYQQLQPLDLQIQNFGDTAVATFHLAAAQGLLARRTLVLTRTADGWKIAHLHGSNLPRVPAPPP